MVKWSLPGNIVCDKCSYRNHSFEMPYIARSIPDNRIFSFEFGCH
jgi:hypothetical protein